MTTTREARVSTNRLAKALDDDQTKQRRRRELRAIERMDECLASGRLTPDWVDRLLDDRLILMEEPPK